MKKLGILLISLVMVFSLAACAKKSADKSSNQNSSMMQESRVKSEMAGQSNLDVLSDKSKKTTVAIEEKPAQSFTDRKMIYNANAVIDVKDVKGTYDIIISKIQEMGGFVANSNLRDTESQITVKIPASKLNDFFKFLDTIKGEKVDSSISANDITEQYTDSESRLRNDKAQEEQLLLVMKKAVTVEDILKVQSELTKIRGEIESLQGKINMWDRLIELSTVTIMLHKTPEIVGKDVKVLFITWNEFTKGITNGFNSSLNFVIRFLNSIFIFLVSLLPLLPIIVIIVWLIFRYKKKKRM